MDWNIDRRAVIGGMGALAAASVAGPARAARERPLNVLMIVTDQEQGVASYPAGLLDRLPAHRELLARGMLVENYHVHTTPCTPSRSNIFQGRHTQQTGLFLNSDNAPYPVAAETMPTLGHMMQAAGYYTSYKGKWHLSRINHERGWNRAPGGVYPTTERSMEKYGFHDYGFDGEEVGLTWDGYKADMYVAGDAARNIIDYGKGMKTGGKPWFQVVGLVNPHDIMFYNTDQPGKPVQEAGNLAHLNHDPAHALYAKKWPTKLPVSFRQRIDAPGRPPAHTDYKRGNDVMLGAIPDNEEWRWHKRHNYYLNCLRDVDRHVAALLDELDARGLAASTIVVLTSDHGELDGAHHLSGKGATSYREQNHVPLIVAHPAYPGGKRCRAVTTHLDIVPTLVALTNASSDKKAAITKDLPGKDFSPVLAAPEKAGHAAVRDGQLYCFNMFATLDGEFLEKARDLLRQPGGPEKLKQGALRPDMMKRGAIRSVFDGRYQFTRYFSPKQHNRPTNIEALLQFNDVELFDHQNDPHELDNLAMDPKKHASLLLAMNEKLNRLIDAEVGEDVGQMLPGGVDAGWVATPAVNDL